MGSVTHFSSMKFLLNLLIFSMTWSYMITSNVSTKFNTTIDTPGNDLPLTQPAYKSIHVKYTFPNNDGQCNIVGIETFIKKSKEFIRQITIQLCDNKYQGKRVWYDDETYCDQDRSMLIYQWVSYSPKSTSYIPEDLGFRWDKSKLIVLSVMYLEEQQSHNHRVRVILHISTVSPRFHVGTLSIGNNRRGIRSYKLKAFSFRNIFYVHKNKKGFSCRSSNYPRLLHSVKPLFPKTMNESWSISTIRSRSFGRKLVQFIVDSTVYLRENRTELEIVSWDVFLIPRDYIMIECAEVLNSNCKFLIYYTYKNLPYKSSDDNDNHCQADNYPHLFKLLPLRTSNKLDNLPPQVSGIDGTTIFLVVCTLLFVIWISIIIGCVIMRRIRGLVNLRTEPKTPYSNQTTKGPFVQARANSQAQQKLLAEGDRTAQLDIEHMGLMS